jgi:hypothetical protein
MTTEPPPTLESLAFHWGDAYLLSYVRDRWVALRRDARYFLTADTLAGLETAIIADHWDNPVARDYDPPDAGDYLNLPGGEPGHGLDLPDEETFPDDEISLEEETLTVLDHLRDTFPHWAISYSTQMRSWTARTRHATICENSAALLCIALTLIERKQHPARNDPRQDP